MGLRDLFFEPEKEPPKIDLTTVPSKVEIVEAKSATPGLTRLLSSIHALATALPDPKLRMKAALITLATDGISREQLLKEIDISLEDLAFHEKQLNEGLEIQRSDIKLLIVQEKQARQQADNLKESIAVKEGTLKEEEERNINLFKSEKAKLTNLKDEISGSQS